MFKLKSFYPLVLALVIAGTGSLLIYNWVGARKVVKVYEESEVKTVLASVAAVDLPWGTKLASPMIKTVPYLQESVPSGYLADAGKLVGRVTISPLKVNEMIFESKLAPTTIESGGVSAIIPPGKRAIAVKGDKVIGISGFVNPGNRVDILVTFKDPMSKLDVSKLVLEDIAVLASGTQIEQNEKGEPAPVDVYTLEVTPEETEKIALAAAEGKLHFALRNITDSGKVPTEGTNIPKTLASLTSGKSGGSVLRKSTTSRKTTTAKKKTTRKNRRSRRSKVVVEIIKGVTLSETTFDVTAREE
jgi:pilus assembly protein CpaB